MTLNNLNSEKMKKLCTNCLYCESRSFLGSPSLTVYLCRNDKAYRIEPVTGEIFRKSSGCIDQRNDEHNTCGVQGNLWKPKN